MSSLLPLSAMSATAAGIFCLAVARRGSGVSGSRNDGKRGGTHAHDNGEVCAICLSPVSSRVAKFMCADDCHPREGWAMLTLPRQGASLRGLPDINACVRRRAMAALTYDVHEDATVELACGHRYHAKCIQPLLDEDASGKCPACTRPIYKCEVDELPSADAVLQVTRRNRPVPVWDYDIEWVYGWHFEATKVSYKPWSPENERRFTENEWNYVMPIHSDTLHIVYWFKGTSRSARYRWYHCSMPAQEATVHRIFEYIARLVGDARDTDYIFDGLKEYGESEVDHRRTPRDSAGRPLAETGDVFELRTACTEHSLAVLHPANA